MRANGRKQSRHSHTEGGLELGVIKNAGRNLEYILVFKDKILHGT